MRRCWHIASFRCDAEFVRYRAFRKADLWFHGLADAEHGQDGTIEADHS